MGTITLVRHGQANSAAKNEADYDHLSVLGHQQARWLGQWFADRGERFDHIYCGTLQRHQETADGIGQGQAEIDARLNELDYFNLSHALAAATGEPMPSADTFAHHMPKLIEAWHRAEIMGNESFVDFEARVTDVLKVAVQPGRNVLCVTSGGVISMMVRHLLDLDPRRMAHIALPIYNTSVHRVHVSPVGPILAGFNAIPHLEDATRAHARTHF